MKLSEVILKKALGCEIPFFIVKKEQTNVLLSSRLSVSWSKDWQKLYALTLLCKVNSWYKSRQ